MKLQQRILWLLSLMTIALLLLDACTIPVVNTALPTSTIAAASTATESASIPASATTEVASLILNGTWQATTKEGSTFSLEIENNTYSSLTFNLIIADCPFPPLEIQQFWINPQIIDGNTLTISGPISGGSRLEGSYAISGTFSSDSAASGTLVYETSSDSRQCMKSLSTNWEATKQ